MYFSALRFMRWFAVDLFTGGLHTRTAVALTFALARLSCKKCSTRNHFECSRTCVSLLRWFLAHSMSLYNRAASVVCPSVRLSICKLLRKSLLLAGKWPDRHQTCSRWSPGKRGPNFGFAYLGVTVIRRQSAIVTLDTQLASSYSHLHTLFR